MHEIVSLSLSLSLSQTREQKGIGTSEKSVFISYLARPLQMRGVCANKFVGGYVLHGLGRSRHGVSLISSAKVRSEWSGVENGGFERRGSRHAEEERAWPGQAIAAIENPNSTKTRYSTVQ